MYIDCESVYSSNSAVKLTSETLRKRKLIWYLCYISVDFIHSCHHRLKKHNYLGEKQISVNRSDLLAIKSPLRLRFLTSLNTSSWKDFLVQERQQSSFWKFSILSNILDLRYWQTRTHCCSWCFLGCANWETFVADTKCSEQTQKHFLCPGHKICVRNIYVARAGKRGNICVGNNVSATMCPLLPVILQWCVPNQWKIHS